MAEAGEDARDVDALRRRELLVAIAHAVPPCQPQVLDEEVPLRVHDALLGHDDQPTVLESPLPVAAHGLAGALVALLVQHELLAAARRVQPGDVCRAYLAARDAVLERRTSPRRALAEEEVRATCADEPRPLPVEALRRSREADTDEAGSRAARVRRDLHEADQRARLADPGRERLLLVAHAMPVDVGRLQDRQMPV
jgi:hypothetical protein